MSFLLLAAPQSSTLYLVNYNEQLLKLSKRNNTSLKRKITYIILQMKMN